MVFILHIDVHTRSHILAGKAEGSKKRVCIYFIRGHAMVVVVVRAAVVDLRY